MTIVMFAVSYKNILGVFREWIPCFQFFSTDLLVLQ